MDTSSGTSRTTTTSAEAPPLITGDQDLVDHLRQLAADTGVEADVTADPAGARARYLAAPLVLLGADQAPALRQARLPKHPNLVLVIAPDLPPAAAQADGEALAATTTVALPTGQPWLREHLAASVAPEPATVVAVLGDRGGAGASVLAAGLAVTAANLGRRVLLVDGDPIGGGLELVLGWEDQLGHRWPDLAGIVDPTQATAALAQLPQRDQLALLSHDRRDHTVTPQTVRAVLAAARYHYDLVVADAVRWGDPASDNALYAANVTLLVVPAQLRAATAAARIAADAAGCCPDVRLVVRGPGRLDADQIATSLRLPLAGTLRSEPRMNDALEAGLPPTASGRGPLAVLCRRLVNQLCPRKPTKKNIR